MHPPASRRLPIAMPARPDHDPMTDPNPATMTTERPLQLRNGAARRPPRDRTTTRRMLLFVVAMLLAPLAWGGSPTAAQTSDEEAALAAQEIQAARDRANAAAAAFLQAQSDLEVLEDEAEALMRETDDLERRVTALRADVEAIAVARFATSGANGIPLLTGLQPPKDQVQAQVLGGVVSVTGASALDEFDLAEKQLAAKRAQLAQRRSDVEAQRESFAALQAEADDEVRRLRQIEEQRLTDEAVQRALQAQQAAELAEYTEAVLRNAEAEARARPNPGVVAAQQAAADAAAATQDGGDGAGDADVGSAGAAGDSGLPVPTVAPNAGASGGTSGGRTGTGGPGSSPMGVLTGDVYLDAIICPMTGAAYGDSWSAPRSGGRRHEGVDMLAPAGTPIYAVVNGVVNFKQNRLGGNAVSLVGDNGNRYYYAHLSSYEGASRRVAQGEVIGYNGDTGNATGVPHLHFEIHPGGGLAVNPTPSVRLAGC